MSVMVLNIEYYERIAKYLSLSTPAEEAKKFCELWHEMNIRNYVEEYKHHGETFQGTEFKAEDLDLYEIAIPAPVQVMSDLKAVLYNTSEHGASINGTMYELLKARIKRLEQSPEYKAMAIYSDYVKY